MWIEYEIKGVPRNDYEEPPVFYGMINQDKVTCIYVNDHERKVVISGGDTSLSFWFELTSHLWDCYDAFRKVLSVDSKCRVELNNIGFVRKL